MQKKLLFLALTCASLTACNSEDVDSDGISTESIWAGIEIASRDGESSRIVAEFNVGGEFGTNLSLSDNDSVSAITSQGTVELERDIDFLDIDYEGTLAIGSESENVRVVFSRENGNSAENSNVTLPAPFELLFPEPDSSFTREDLVEIVWSPVVVDGRMTLFQEGECRDSQNNLQVVSRTIEVEDDGVYMSDFLTTFPDLTGDQDCDYSILLRRVNQGTLDPAFEEGGFIRAFQDRETNDIEFQL